METNLRPIKTLLKSIGEKKTKDYTFSIIFFLVFSVFIMFAIRPTLSKAIELQKEEEDLKLLDKQYEQILSRIVRIQNDFQAIRDKLYLVNEALPEKPKINVIIQDIQESASKNGFGIEKINVNKVNLIEQERDIFRSLVINLEASSSFENLVKFEKEIALQRRLKKIKLLEVVRNEFGATDSGTLKMKVYVEGFYL